MTWPFKALISALRLRHTFHGGIAWPFKVVSMLLCVKFKVGENFTAGRCGLQR